jgi:hypothetical protein
MVPTVSNESQILPAWFPRRIVQCVTVNPYAQKHKKAAGNANGLLRTER